ncbi:hypothetical protein Bhyg_06982 [Pseudolycoriella hygida]|uniref:Uncharacterized protein n=1 Tax=Pseudolycoriella hygida TaxID=35572 RepID=A0A9Q0N3A0_9DIPT|nr:hypothetical protein Bhyg_06982 [Pseudolycoriella hygida]
MTKEQKLVAEKLIKEVLFQGQMEAFQYSDKAVHIPGHMLRIHKESKPVREPDLGK